MRKALPALFGSLPPGLGGLAGVLAQAPAVSAAFGRWLGFILMMMAIGDSWAACAWWRWHCPRAVLMTS
jgi:hypothetical protein